VSLDIASIHEGDELPPLELTPTIAQAVRYCAINWVFPEFFFDPDFAKSVGMPGTMVPGPLKLGLIYRAIDDWLGGAGFIRQVRAAHRRPDLAKRPIVITGRVARVYEEGGKRRADLEMAVVNEEGQPSVRGFAVVEFA
jgi:hypothetical protein